MKCQLTATAVLLAATITALTVSAPAHAGKGKAPATDLKCKGCVDKKDIAKDAVDSTKIKDGQVKPADLHKSAQPGGVSNDELLGTTDLGNDFQPIIATTVDAPAPGYVLAIATWMFNTNQSSTIGQCFLTTTSGVQEGPQAYAAPGSAATFIWDSGTLARTFPVPAGETTFYLNCTSFGTNMDVVDPAINAVYFPQRYEPPS